MELTKNQLYYIHIIGIDSYISLIKIKIKDLTEVINSNGSYIHLNHHWFERGRLLNLCLSAKKYKNQLLKVTK